MFRNIEELHIPLARKEGKRGLLYERWVCLCKDCAPYYYKNELVSWIARFKELRALGEDTRGLVWCRSVPDLSYYNYMLVPATGLRYLPAMSSMF